ncbi:MAG TPA: peptide chain release factor 1 [Gemmatales bacterium]|nr:peptide chain release factor 1 [Gemmatales bacterium]HMP60700.1 peptide chain release factor 1 [Gemmatales bacterium]
MWAKLDETLAKFEDVERQLADPASVADSTRYTRLAKEHGSLAKIARPYQEYKRLLTEIAPMEAALAAESDPEMKAYMEEEVQKLRDQSAVLYQKLEDLILVDPGEDFDSVIVEIRAGTGGDEAALFAGDLFNMYRRYAETQGWKLETLDFSPTDLGGMKEISFSLTGDGVYRHLRYESGGHRVQRVPKTEAQGRIHTSAATVAVLPEPSEIQIEIKSEDVRVDTFCSGGPGGQHQNKTQSGVRLTHVPTGTVAESRSERSQLKNKDICWRMLRTRIYENLQAQEHAKRAAERKNQIGSGDRSERIRTYNFPQNRVTDHRINLTLHRLDAIIMGDMAELIRGLMDYDKAQQLKALGITTGTASVKPAPVAAAR